MTYEKAVKTIHSRLKFGVKPGLSRMKALLSELLNVQNDLKYIHVAGTNGKGTTCVLIAEALKKSGYKTGLFMSPFVTDFRERIQINRKMIPKKKLSEFTEKILPIVKKLDSKGEFITEFEFITALAFCYFASENCDIVVLETGLGGRLDSTNIIKTPLASVITHISYDHQAVLGNTLMEIASEKSGIIKKNGRTVCYPLQNNEVLSVLIQKSAQMNNTFYMLNSGCVKILKSDIYGSTFLYGETNITIPFAGEHQVYNAVTAIETLDVLKNQGFKITQKQIISAFKTARLAARQELLSQEPMIILDGSHNESGINALSHTIKSMDKKGKVYSIMGMLEDKEHKKSLECIAPVFDTIFTVKINNNRSLCASQLAKEASLYTKNVLSADSIDDAIKKVFLKIKKNDILIVCGSLYLAGEIRPKLINEIKNRQNKVY